MLRVRLKPEGRQLLWLSIRIGEKEAGGLPYIFKRAIRSLAVGFGEFKEMLEHVLSESFVE